MTSTGQRPAVEIKALIDRVVGHPRAHPYEGVGAPLLAVGAVVMQGMIDARGRAVEQAVERWARDVPVPCWRDLLAVVARAYWRVICVRAAGRMTVASRLAGVSRRAVYAAVARVGLRGQAGGAATSAPTAEGEG